MQVSAQEYTVLGGFRRKMLFGTSSLYLKIFSRLLQVTLSEIEVGSLRALTERLSVFGEGNV